MEQDYVRIIEEINFKTIFFNWRSELNVSYLLSTFSYVIYCSNDEWLKVT